MNALLDANLWTGLLVEDSIEWQTTMFQPVGGMDRIPTAFASRLDPVIRYGSEVTRIRQSDTGVTVDYRDSSAGQYCPIRHTIHQRRLLHLRHAAHHGAYA